MNSTRTTTGRIIALSMLVAGFADARPAFARHGASGPTATAKHGKLSQRLVHELGAGHRKVGYANRTRLRCV